MNLAVTKRCFSFTWNNPGKEASLFLKKLGNSEGISELIYQLEIGEKRRTPHLQGYIYFKNGRHLSAVIKLLRGCHVQIAKNIFALKEYCKKVKSRMEPFFHFKNGKQVSIYKEDFLKLDIYKFLIKEDQLYPWQAKVEEIFLSIPDNRSVYYFYEVEGNTGKSSLIGYLSHKYPGRIFSTGGRPIDIKSGFSKRIQKDGKEFIRMVIWDIPRLLLDKRTKQLKDSIFLTAEQFKNGRFYNEKYESGEVQFAVPHILIFSNIKPDHNFSSRLSRDRWKIYEIRNKELLSIPLP